MNEKYAQKPKANPNEPKLFGFHLVVNVAEASSFGVTQPDRSGRPHFCPLPFYFYLPKILKKYFWKNEPNFFTTKYALSISKTQKGRPKS
jgi:hypothetical protein